MTEPLTMRAFHADDRTRDWRVVGDGAAAVFRTDSFAAGARLVQAIAAAVGDAGPHHPDVGLQHDTVTVRLLEANGWTETAGGKHVVKMTEPGHRPITLPHDKGGGGYPIGLTMAIMRQAGLKGDDE